MGITTIGTIYPENCPELPNSEFVSNVIPKTCEVRSYGSKDSAPYVTLSSCATCVLNKPIPTPTDQSCNDFGPMRKLHSTHYISVTMPSHQVGRDVGFLELQNRIMKILKLPSHRAMLWYKSCCTYWWYKDK